MASPLIRIVGSLNADLTTITPRFPQPGETLTAKSFSTNPGGKGANQAVACARLSRSRPSSSQQSQTGDVRIEMVGAVGTSDGYYDTLLRPVLEECGIDVTGIIKVNDMSTGVAVIIVDESAGGENRILFTAGANYAGMGADCILRALRTPLPDVLVLQAEIPFATTVKILESVKEKGVDVVFNPAPAPPEALPLSAYRDLAHLVVNETECEQLISQFGPEDFSGVKNAIARAETELVGNAVKFHHIGVRNVIITLGAKGVFASGSGGGNHEMIPAEKVISVVDTTAAGDTFVGAYAVEVARWKAASGRSSGAKGESFDISSAVKRANKAAAVCVQRRGAMGSVPWDDEIDWH